MSNFTQRGTTWEGTTLGRGGLMSAQLNIQTAAFTETGNRLFYKKSGYEISVYLPSFLRNIKLLKPADIYASLDVWIQIFIIWIKKKSR